MVGPSGAVDVGRRVFSTVSEKNVPFMAAGIAYTALVSLAPLLVLLLFVVSALGGGLEDRLIAIAEGSLPGPIADVVTGIFAGTSAAAGASFVGLVVLLWGTLKIFRGLDTAFSEIYETGGENSLVDKFVDGLVVLGALLVAVVSTVAVSTAFAAFAGEVPFLGYLTPLVLVGGLVLAFYPIYWRFPDTDLGWRDVLPGTVFAAVGWAALQAVFQVYLVFKGGGSGGFLGGVIVVVTWLYFSGLVLLVGAVLNAVVGGYSTGAPGGVGRGAGTEASDVDSRRSMGGAELASYLRDLRRRLTGYHEEVEPATEPNATDRRPEGDVAVSELDGRLRRYRPTPPVDGEAEVVERSDGDARAVTIRWETAGGDPDE